MRTRKSRIEAWRSMSFAAVAAAVALPACEPSRVHDVTLVDGADTLHFATKSAFAEYVELPGVENELRITLASYELSCEHWERPKDGETALTITIVTPADQKP